MTDAYIRLIAGSSAATGTSDGDAPHMLAQHMQRLADLGGQDAAHYAEAAEHLRHASEVAVRVNKARYHGAGSGVIRATWGKVRKNRILKVTADRVIERLKAGQTTLIPAMYVRLMHGDAHMMYLLASREHDASGKVLGTYTLQLFNSGGTFSEEEWQRFHVRSAVNGKWQTMATFDGVRLGEGEGALNRATLTKLFRLAMVDADRPLEGDRCVYDWLGSLGTLHNDPSLPGHAKQKVGSCTHKGIVSFLAYTLPKQAFLGAKATLLTDAVRQLAEKNGPVDSLALPALALRKAARAHAKVGGAPSTRTIVERPLPGKRDEFLDRLMGRGHEAELGIDEPPAPGLTRGSAQMLEGHESIDHTPFAPTQAVYFPNTDGKYYHVILSDESDLATNLWHGTRPEGRFQRVYLRVRQDSGKGTVGFHLHRDDEAHPFVSQSACIKSSANAKQVSSESGVHLVGAFAGEPGSRSGRVGEQMLKNKFKGEFSAALLDMRNRQLVRPEIENYCEGWE